MTHPIRRLKARQMERTRTARHDARARGGSIFPWIGRLRTLALWTTLALLLGVFSGAMAMVAPSVLSIGLIVALLRCV